MLTPDYCCDMAEDIIWHIDGWTLKGNPKRPISYCPGCGKKITRQNLYKIGDTIVKVTLPGITLGGDGYVPTIEGHCQGYPESPRPVNVQELNDIGKPVGPKYNVPLHWLKKLIPKKP